MDLVQMFQNRDKKLGLYQKKVKSYTEVPENALAVDGYMLIYSGKL